MKLFVTLFTLLIIWTSGALAQTYEEQVQEAYLSYYGRPADPAGLQYWTGEVATANGSLGQVIDAFGNSNEYINRYGGLDHPELVNNIYLQLLGRDGDQAGISFYVASLDAGTRTLGSIAIDIADGVPPDSVDAQVVRNRLSVSDAFTVAVADGTLTYQGNEQVELARSMLASVNADIDTRDAAIASISLDSDLDGEMNVYDLDDDADGVNDEDDAFPLVWNDPVADRTPVNPVYGANGRAFAGVGIESLVSTGLSGLGVNVCVVDSGLDGAHPGFAHLFARGAVTWRDFTPERSLVPVDTNGHGTHVAGVVAMDGELSGGAPNVNLLIARVFGADGSTDVNTIASAVDWCRTSDADLISMSLGGLTLPAIQALLQVDPSESEAAVERALDAGVYVIAAAGNTELTRDVATPAGVSGVIAVAALEQDLDTKALFSQSGLNDGTRLIPPRFDPDKKPEVSAAGVDVVSAIAAGSAFASDVDGCSGVVYCELSGTSQATPFVTAALALVLEARPEFQRENLAGDGRAAVDRIKSALAASAKALAGQSVPHDDGRGYGLLQAAGLLNALAHEGIDD